MKNLKIKLTPLGAQQRRATLISRLGQQAIRFHLHDMDKHEELKRVYAELLQKQADLRRTPVDDFLFFRMEVSPSTKVSDSYALELIGFNPRRNTAKLLIESVSYES
jgi:hypothetical protein